MLKYPALAVVIDPGTDTLKAGFAGESGPCVVCPDMISKVGEEIPIEPVVKDVLPPGVADAVDMLLGADNSPPSSPASTLSSSSSSEPDPCELHILEHPMANGLVTDWEVMLEVLDQTFREKLKVQPKDHPVLMASSPLSTKYMHEKMTELLFESFDVPGLFIHDTAVLSLYSAGLDSGLVVESGHASTYTCVVSEGVALTDTIPKTFYAGKDITRYLSCMLSGKKSQNCSINIEDYMKDIKETMCFVSEDYKRDIKLASTGEMYLTEYTLPSGESISLNQERMVAPESMFRPMIFGCNCPGIHGQIVRTLKMADPSVRKSACANILLSGGNTMFPGMNTRLQIELDKIIPPVLGANVLNLPDQHYAAWVGGSKMAASDMMSSRWITREEYDDIGAAVVHFKCI